MKKSNKEDEVPTHWKRICNSIEQMKKHLAGLLSERHEQLSQRGKKVSLMLFGLIMAGASLYLMISPGQSATTLSEVTAQLPLQIHGQPHEPIITREEYGQLMSFRHALDSLHAVNPVLYSRIVQERKGLLDSLDLLINLYQNQ